MLTGNDTDGTAGQRPGGGARNLDDFASDTMRRAEDLSLEVADISGTIEGVARFVLHQVTLFRNLAGIVSAMNDSTEGIGSASQQTLDIAVEANEQVTASRNTIQEAIAEIKQMAESIRRVEDHLSGLSESLKNVSSIAEGIQAIAKQTNLLALNATIEAARAGEAGKGFAVVAGEVKALANQTSQSTDQINETVKKLNDRTAILFTDVTQAIKAAESVTTGVNVINETIDGYDAIFKDVETNVEKISVSAHDNSQKCVHVTTELDKLTEGVNLTSGNLKTADERVSKVLNLSEGLIGFIAKSGLKTHDTKFIDAVRRTASDVSALFEAALESGKISQADLFDRTYVPIPNTNPEQVTTRFVDFTDGVLPAIQEPLLDLDSKIVFCAVMDENAFLPTHNLKFSKPQGADPEWNNANCRNRRVFNDRTGLTAAQNKEPFILQTYRRDMGGGSFTMMKDISAPVWVRDRHWGCFRMGVKI